jgi:flagellar protein FlbT
MDMDAAECLPPPAASPGRGHLVIELRAGQRMLANGAVLLFRGRCSIVLCNRVRFLFGRQILDADQATTPARRLYHALQQAYAGLEEEREDHAAIARRLVAEQLATRTPEGRAILRAALQELAFDRCRAALILVRRLFAEDDADASAPRAPEGASLRPERQYPGAAMPPAPPRAPGAHAGPAAGRRRSGCGRR